MVNQFISGNPEAVANIPKTPVKPPAKTLTQISDLEKKYQDFLVKKQHAREIGSIATSAKIGTLESGSDKHKALQGEINTGKTVEDIRRGSVIDYHQNNSDGLKAKGEWLQAKSDRYYEDKVIPSTGDDIGLVLAAEEKRGIIHKGEYNAIAVKYLREHDYIQKRIADGATLGQLRDEVNAVKGEEKILALFQKNNRGETLSPSEVDIIRDTDVKDVILMAARKRQRDDYVKTLEELNQLPNQQQEAIDALENVRTRLDKEELDEARINLDQIVRGEKATPSGKRKLGVDSTTLNQLDLQNTSSQPSVSELSAPPSEVPYPKNQYGVAEIPMSPNMVIIKDFTAGGTGEARLIQIPGVDRPVLQKVSRGGMSNEKFVKREATLLTELKRRGVKWVPEIVGVKPAGEKGNEYFYEEYVTGETIDRLAERSILLPADGSSQIPPQSKELAQACYQFSQAVAELHDNQLKHRDLQDKPAHVIWASIQQPDGSIKKQIKIIDLGNSNFHTDQYTPSPFSFPADTEHMFNTVLQYGFGLKPIPSSGPTDAWEKEIQANVKDPQLLKICNKFVNERMSGYSSARQLFEDLGPVLQKWI